MTNGFSIILCCYNSAGRLAATLDHLSRLEIPVQCGAELLVVDNASTDHTATMAVSIWESAGAPFPLKILSEPLPGLSHARMRGIREAGYEYLLFCDDDNWLSRDYLTEALKILQSDPSIGMLGGLGEGVSETEMPRWRSEFAILGCGKQAPENGEAQVLYGAGVILRKSAFDKLLHTGYRFMLTDRKKKLLSSGGDYELCYAIRLAGYKLWYDDKLSFRHYLSGERFSEDYVIRFVKESSEALNILGTYRYFLHNRKPQILPFYFHLLHDMLHHSKRLFIYYFKYKRADHADTRSIALRFKYTFHRCRLFFLLKFLFSAGTVYKKISHLNDRLNHLRPEYQKA